MAQRGNRSKDPWIKIGSNSSWKLSSDQIFQELLELLTREGMDQSKLQPIPKEFYDRIQEFLSELKLRCWHLTNAEKPRLEELIRSTQRALAQLIKLRLSKLFRAALMEIQLRDLPKLESQFLESAMELVARFRSRLLDWSDLELVLVLADLDRMEVAGKQICPRKEDLVVIPRSAAIELSKHELVRILRSRT